MKINNTDNEIGEEDEIILPFCFDNVHMGTLSNDDRSVCKSCSNNAKYGHQPHLILENKGTPTRVSRWQEVCRNVRECAQVVSIVVGMPQVVAQDAPILSTFWLKFENFNRYE